MPFIAYLSRELTEEEKDENLRIRLFLLKKRLMLKYKDINIGELMFKCRPRYMQ